MDDETRIAVEAALERIRRRTAEEDNKRHKRLTANAIAMGFSSLEDQRQQEWDEGIRLEAEYEQRLPEIAAAAGKTVEEYHRDLYSNKDLKPPSPMPSFSQCDCEEHPNPWFCPATLLEYRSQDRPDFWDYEELNRTRIETLRIEPESQSGRLDTKTLEKAWDMIGLTTLPLPVWARAKPEILAISRVDSKAPLDNLRQNTPSLASASLRTTSVTTSRSSSNGFKHDIESKPLKRDQPTRRRSLFTIPEKCLITKIVKHPRPPARKT